VFRPSEGQLPDSNTVKCLCIFVRRIYGALVDLYALADWPRTATSATVIDTPQALPVYAQAARLRLASKQPSTSTTV
jgi:hypothetical protein